MRIAFVGKGGSGKTTLSSLFCRHLAAQGLPVLAIDADINQHLAEALGMSEEDAGRIPALGNDIDRIKEYVRGSNPLVPSNTEMIKTTPPGPGSRLLHLGESNPVFDHFIRRVEGIDVMATGLFHEHDLGVKCYHAKTGAVEMILNHLIDREGEYVVVDMTAGADSFASGLFTKFDLTLMVCEPTQKSLGVYRQYVSYAKGHDVNIKVIANKIESTDDMDFIRKEVGDRYLTSFPQSSFVRAMEKGERPSLDHLDHSVVEALSAIQAEVDRTQKDWRKFYKQTVEFHLKNAEAWASAQIGQDLSKQIDPEFSLS